MKGMIIMELKKVEEGVKGRTLGEGKAVLG